MVVRPAVFLSVRPDRIEPLGNKGIERIGTVIGTEGVDKVFEERGV